MRRDATQRTVAKAYMMSPTIDYSAPIIRPRVINGKHSDQHTAQATAHRRAVLNDGAGADGRVPPDGRGARNLHAVLPAAQAESFLHGATRRA